MPVFNGKTYNLQTQKYDVTMTSLVAKFTLVECSFPPKYSLKIL